MTPIARIASLLLSITSTAFGGPMDGTAPPQDTRWYTITLDGQPIGYEKTTVSSVDGNADLVKIFRRTEMQVRRLGSTIKMQTLLWTTQSRSGRLFAFDLKRLDTNGQRMERSGALSDDGRSFEITERIAATRTTKSVSINGDVRSPVIIPWLPDAMTSSASSGARQQFTVFFPESVGTATITATLQPYRQMILPDGDRITAARLEYSTGTRVTQPTRLLIDEGRQLIRKEKTLMNRPLVLAVATADDAVRSLQSESLDLDAQAIIPVDRPISFRNKPTLILELSVDRGFLMELPETPFQKVQSTSSSAAMIRLTECAYPQVQRSGTFGLRPQPLPPTPLMPTDDTLLQRMAQQVTTGKTDPVQVAMLLQQHVQRLLKFSAFSTVLLPADEVAKQKKGDCTEHAILLATLLRIQGIPSRIASGIVLVPGRPGFTGHVWVEAQINDTWFPFDSTAGPATELIRIKLADDDFCQGSQSTGVALFVPILDLAGRATLKVKTGQ